MAESFAELKPKSELLFSQHATTGASETSPKGTSPQIHEFAKDLGGVASVVPVVVDECGLYGWCSDGVIEKVRRDGGGILFGWIIWEWAGLLLTA